MILGLDQDASSRRSFLIWPGALRGTCKAFLAITLVLVATGLLQPAHAQSGVMRIAAVVNDDIISVLDLEQRLRLVALSSGIQVTEESKRRLLPQVLRGMIDERLQIQEATANGIDATDREVEREITNLAQRNNVPADQFAPFLASRGIDIETLRQQIRVRIAWQKYANRRLSRSVSVGSEEIDDELERLRSVADLPQKRVFEIFLSIDNPDREVEVRRNAERLLEQLRGGADFRSLARSFSQSGSAREGGDLGWLTPGQLSPELDERLSTLDVGNVSSPIPTFAGIYLLFVADQRIAGRDPNAVRVDLLQLTERLPRENREAARTASLQALTSLRTQVNSCDDLRAVGQARATANIAAANDLGVAELPQRVAPEVAQLSVNQTTPPIDLGSNIVMITLCAKNDPGVVLPTREQIEETLGVQKMELVIRRKLRDLRREAFVDVRL